MQAATGLTAEQARAALERFGPNALPAERTRSLVQRLGAQLKSALIYMLLFALAIDVVAWAIAGAEDVPLEALAILCVILLNAVLGVLQEYRSEQALLELRRLGAPRAWVLRGGYFEHMEATAIVPGDLVRLEAGDRVPADGAVRTPEALCIDESALTGESMPVDKAEADELLSGTLVSHGRASLHVERTGPSSNMGKLAATLGAIDTSKTPLERRVDELGRTIARVVAAICLVMVVAGFAVNGFSKPLPILVLWISRSSVWRSSSPWRSARASCARFVLELLSANPSRPRVIEQKGPNLTLFSLVGHAALKATGAPPMRRSVVRSALR